jgi:hypothetical protein
VDHGFEAVRAVRVVEHSEAMLAGDTLVAFDPHAAPNMNASDAANAYLATVDAALLAACAVDDGVQYEAPGANSHRQIMRTSPFHSSKRA